VKKFILPIIFLIIFVPVKIPEFEFPVYRLVLDPGHGGQCKSPMKKYGDRYDLISGKYLDQYKDGASRRGLHEHVIVYSIAKKAEKILKLCSPGGDFEKFKQILKKYSDDEPERINIITRMSRGKSLTGKKSRKMDDPNGEFRLFDYPDKKGQIKPGRISRINAFKPHLVVSLHLAGSAPGNYKGMNPVLAAPHRILDMGLQYLREEREDRAFIKKYPYDDWFSESVKRTSFQWFLSDVSMYYTGYPLKKNLRAKKNGFKGYRYNMVDWAYKDTPGWENIAKSHVRYTRYSREYMNIQPRGDFWDRERTKFEEYRRDNGEEGFGGDNAYASYEIIRYILYSLNIRGASHRKQKPGRPYVSIWIMPLHVNAINAFIELGYLNRRRDRFLLTKKQNEMAEGIAVGIYSLFTGITPADKKYRYAPKGKKIDLNKYRISSDTSYFDIVSDK